MKTINYVCIHGLEATISHIALSDILKYCHIAQQKEIGGILVGKYSPDNRTATITFASGPPPDSKHSTFSFKRGTSGIKQLLDEKWIDGEYYVGDWHYHPNFASRPSRQDINQMKHFAVHGGLKCPEPLLFIVGGSALAEWNFTMYIITKKENIPMTMQQGPLGVNPSF